MFTISETLAPMGTIWAGFESPVSMGPMAVAAPRFCTSSDDIEAAFRPGMTSTLAGPDSRQNGWPVPTAGKTGRTGP